MARDRHPGVAAALGIVGAFAVFGGIFAVKYGVQAGVETVRNTFHEFEDWRNSFDPSFSDLLAVMPICLAVIIAVIITWPRNSGGVYNNHGLDI